MNAYLYRHDDPRRASLPPHLHQQPFPHPAPAFFPFSGPQFTMSPFPLSYPGPFVPQPPPFMPQQFTPVSRPAPHLLNDPAFSPDPRSNPHFFSMNDREEIYPASIADSLSDYAPTVPDEESEVDHSHLPPRMRLINGPDPSPPSSIHHGRSYSVPYVPPSPPPHNLARSSSARVIPVPPPVIPVPPPVSRASTPGSHLRKGSPDDRRLNVPPSAPGYASASLAAQEMWQPPPPYSDSDTDSYSSSNPQTPSATPPSASSHLPPHGSKSTPPPIDKRASQPPSHPVATTSAPQVAPQPTNGTSAIKTSTVQSTATRPPITPRNASAPELHPPPDPVDVPPRPSTVPIPAPPPQPAAAPPPRRRRNSKNPSIVAAPRDLDRIDELDESDPLGFAWHHDGPYEAIAKAASSHPDASSGSGQKPKQRPKRKPVQPFDVSVGVTPGQIFPSFSQYQPQSAGNGVPQQLDPSVVPPMPPSGNFPVTSPPMSPLMLPVQRHVPPTGSAPPTPDLYSNVHMSAMHATPAPRNASLPDQSSQNQIRPQQPQARPPQRSMQSQPPPMPSDAPQRAPSESNHRSPAQVAFPNARPSRQDAPPQMSRPQSMMQARPDLPSSSVAPRPDISLPPPRQEKSAQEKSTPFLPRHLPKKLVMPAPLQQSAQQNQRLQPGQAHVEILAQRHGPAVPPKPPSPPALTTHQQQQQQQQQGRAKDIPMSHGPNLLKKRHTLGAPVPAPGPAEGEAAGSSATAALFAARVRFAEPPRDKEESKEERKRREKEEARREKEAKQREKEEAKRERERARAIPREVPMQGMFQPDYAREAEMERARARETAHLSMSAAAKASGRKLSKRR